MEAPPEVGLFETSLHSLPLIARGKVRDNYAVGDDRILMVASDRLSAFDVVMTEPIPGKGKVLTEMALFWFEKLKHIVPNHLTGDDPESVVADDEREQVRGRSMLVRRLKPLPIEAVVRGYLAGSGWKEYQASGSVCGVQLPPGLKNASKLPVPIFTPATKAEMGSHDENIDFARMSDMIGPKLAGDVRNAAIRLYIEAADFALKKGIIIADTKFEFGLDDKGVLTLMDEVLTPDSSRFWPAESYAEGTSPPSLDKQAVRDWLEKKGWNKQPPPPTLPLDVSYRLSYGYVEALDRLTLPSKAKSRLEQTLSSKVSTSTGHVERNCYVAELCMSHSRAGNLAEARQDLLRLRQSENSDLREILWRNIAEALYDHYSGANGLVKIKRAYALSAASSHGHLHGISSVWLAQFLRESCDIEGIARFTQEALRFASKHDYSTRARANLIVGDMLLSADREDLSSVWHKRAREYALMLGDDATLSALAFNIALMRFSRLRHAVLGGFASESLAATASFYTKNALTAERLLGTKALADLGQLQLAGVLSLEGEPALALPILLAFAHSTSAQSSKRMRAEWSSDISWCYVRLGLHSDARSWALTAISELSDDVHLDDRASVNSRIGRVYASLGESREAQDFFRQAEAGWAEYENLQQKIVELFAATSCD